MDALLSGLTEPARERLALIWKMRAVGERQSTLRFAAYAGRMAPFQVPQRFQDEAWEASEQERTHQEVCDETAHRLGFGEITYEPHDFTVPPTADPANLLADMVAFCCVAETINVAMLSTALRDITHPEMRSATRKILGDEIKHSRLGWAYLSWARTQGEGGLLAPHLPKMLRQAAPAELFVEGPPLADEVTLRAMGDPPMVDRRAIVLQTLSEVIFPGLDASGISTEDARAWLAHPTWPYRPTGG